VLFGPGQPHASSVDQTSGAQVLASVPVVPPVPSEPLEPAEPPDPLAPVVPPDADDPLDPATPAFPLLPPRPAAPDPPSALPPPLPVAGFAPSSSEEEQATMAASNDASTERHRAVRTAR